MIQCNYDKKSAVGRKCKEHSKVAPELLCQHPYPDNPGFRLAGEPESGSGKARQGDRHQRLEKIIILLPRLRSIERSPADCCRAEHPAGRARLGLLRRRSEPTEGEENPTAGVGLFWFREITNLLGDPMSSSSRSKSPGPQSSLRVRRRIFRFS